MSDTYGSVYWEGLQQKPYLSSTVACTNGANTKQCNIGTVLWKLNDCGANKPQPTCSAANIAECQTYGSVEANSVIFTDPNANTTGDKQIQCQYKASDFKTADDVKAWLNNNSNDDAHDYWLHHIMPYFVTLPADTPPPWAGPADQLDDFSDPLCSRMFSLSDDGLLCRNWRTEQLDAVSRGDPTGAVEYDQYCQWWASKYPWLPESACVMRTNDPYYQQVVSVMESTTPNDGCWYKPCIAGANLNNMLIMSNEALPPAGVCTTDCVEVINAMNDYYVQIDDNKIGCSTSSSSSKGKVGQFFANMGPVGKAVTISGLGLAAVLVLGITGTIIYEIVKPRAPKAEKTKKVTSEGAEDKEPASV